MKRSLTFAAVALFTAAAPLSAQIMLDIANVSGAVIQFVGTGDNVFFVAAPSGPDTGFDFKITTPTSPLVNFRGNIDGLFTIGAITVSGSLQEAPVSGSGTFSIWDGATSLTADLVWLDTLTYRSIGGLNTDSALNLSNFTYTGLNQDLADLRDYGNSNLGSLVVSFQFASSKSLTTLTTDGQENSTSYSGTLNVIPEPSTYAAILCVLSLGVVGVKRWRGRKALAA